MTQTSPSSTTPPPEASGTPSTKDPGVGDVVLVRVDVGVVRPMTVTFVGARRRVNGLIACEPEDHTRPAFRGWSRTYIHTEAHLKEPIRHHAAIHGHPDRTLPLGYGEGLAPGSDIGEWVPKETPVWPPATK